MKYDIIFPPTIHEQIELRSLAALNAVGFKAYQTLYGVPLLLLLRWHAHRPLLRPMEVRMRGQLP
jgi:hypothetical protein